MANWLVEAMFKGIRNLTKKQHPTRNKNKEKITPATFYVLGLKVTYKLGLKIQKKIIEAPRWQKKTSTIESHKREEVGKIHIACLKKEATKKSMQ